MHLLGRKAHAAAWTVSHGFGTYRAIRRARRRLSTKRRRMAIVVLAGGGLAAGLAGGFALGARYGRGCEHEHEHDHSGVDDEAVGHDLPAASVQAQAEHAPNGAPAL